MICGVNGYLMQVCLCFSLSVGLCVVAVADDCVVRNPVHLTASQWSRDPSSLTARLGSSAARCSDAVSSGFARSQRHFTGSQGASALTPSDRVYMHTPTSASLHHQASLQQHQQQQQLLHASNAHAVHVHPQSAHATMTSRQVPPEPPKRSGKADKKSSQKAKFGLCAASMV